MFVPRSGKAARACPPPSPPSASPLHPPLPSPSPASSTLLPGSSRGSSELRLGHILQPYPEGVPAQTPPHPTPPHSTEAPGLGWEGPKGKAAPLPT